MRNSKLAMTAAVCLAAALSFDPPVTRAAPYDLGAEVRKLFQAGWNRTKAGREGAQRQYEELRRLAPGDLRINYAYALVQLRQNRYREAVELFDQVLDADKQHLGARNAQIWLSVLTKQFPRAMHQMQQAAELLPDEDAAAEAEEPYRRFAVFLGRIFGYLDGPVKEQVSEAARADCRRQIMAQLTTTRRAAFDAAQKSVVAEFSGAAEQAELSATEAELEAARRKDRALEELNSRENEMAAAAAAEQQRLAQLKEKAEYEIRDLQDEDRKLAGELHRIEVNAIGARRELSIFEGRIDELLARAEEEEDPARKQRLLDSAARWRIDRNRALSVLREMESHHFAVNRQRGSLLQHRQQIELQLRREAGGIEKLHGTLKRVRGERERVSGEPISGKTAGVLDQRRRSTALTTYIPTPFSLETEMKRVLALFQ